MDGGLQLSSPCSCLCPCPSPLAKLIKTPIRINPLAFRLCGVYTRSSSKAEELGYMNRRNYSEHIKEWGTHFAKTT